MKKLTLSILLALPMFCAGQTKPDTTRYKLTEQQILQIDQLLLFGDNCASNSTTVSTADWKAYHVAVMKLDSIFRRQYVALHPDTIKNVKK